MFNRKHKKSKEKATEETSKEEVIQQYTGSLTFEELDALNRELYRICGEMHENKDFINGNPVLKRVMWSEITKAYIARSEEIKEEREVPQAIKRYVAINKRALLMPDTELKRRYPWRKYGLNAMAELCVKQAQIEAAVESSAIEEEIARQATYVYGERTVEDEIYEALLSEFIPKRKRIRFIRKSGKYLTRLLSEYMQKENLEEKIDELTGLIADELVFKKQRKKFMERNGKYLKALLTEFILNREIYTEDESAEDEQSAPETTETEPNEEVAEAETTTPENGEETPESDADEDTDEYADLRELEESDESEDEPDADESADGNDEIETTDSGQTAEHTESETQLTLTLEPQAADESAEEQSGEETENNEAATDSESGGGEE